ncbi:hypothetical protein ES703_83798 [subsurface metagenome]
MSVGTKKGIDKKELLRLVGISSITLHYWIYRGLLPRWSGRWFPGQCGSYYEYPPETLELAKKIKAWRAEGKRYREIRALLRAGGAGE